MNLDSYLRRIESQLAKSVAVVKPDALRKPIAHVVEAGGKRIRPVITLLACEAAGGKASEALDAAVAIELLHTFTLVHDDIMDNSALRRGRTTVHTTWNVNTAILAGDTIAALASQSLVRKEHPRASRIGKLFSTAFYEVCAGQALDKEQERATTVAMKPYLEMIGLKTAAMFAAAAAIGGCVASGNAKTINTLHTFGRELGMAFQIRDDALNVDADDKKFGKDSGGDIREGKKGFLFVAAHEAPSTAGDKKLLRAYRANQGLRNADVARLAAFYRRAGVLDIAEKTIAARTKRALNALRDFPRSAAREKLEALAGAMTSRRF